MREISDANWEFARRLFECVAVASRPLRVEELAEILAFDFKAGPIPKFCEGWRLPNPVDAVLSTCSTLLAIVDVKGSSVVQFAHFSVKEYLISARLAEASEETCRRYHVSMTHAHTLVAQACLGVLLHLDENITQVSLKKFPLANYAGEHWVGHSLFENVSQKLEDGMKQLFDPSKPHFAVWIWIHDPYRDFQTKRAERPLPPIGTPLHYAAHCGLHAIARFLIAEHSLDVNSRSFEDNSTPLRLTSMQGHVEIARVLLETGADVMTQDKDGRSPLHWASSSGHVEVARVLLEGGADTNTQDKDRQSPLHLASSKGHLEVARVLLEGGTDASTQDKDGRSPLHLASSKGHVEVARVLLEGGADASTQAKNGQSPLHRASSHGHVELARVLLEEGADASTQAKNGQSPLHLASFWGYVEVARVLLEEGADASTQDNYGWSPLHMASSHGHVEVARVLLEGGADASTQNMNGRSPLHLASSKGHVEVTRVLLEGGADLSIQDEDGRSPLHLASKSSRRVEMTRVLLEAGAER